MFARLITVSALVVACAGLALPSLAAGATMPKPKPIVLAYTVKDGRVVKGNQHPTVKKGKVVRIVVVANRGEEVHLHGYDFEKPVRAGKKTVIQFISRVPGRFELELHHPDIVIARLSVRP